MSFLKIQNFDLEVSLPPQQMIVTISNTGINYGTEISFHDAKRAFLKIQNPSVEEALLQRIVFSFRTDRRDALLIFLHDQLYNFIQVSSAFHGLRQLLRKLQISREKHIFGSLFSVVVYGSVLFLFLFLFFVLRWNCFFTVFKLLG